MVGLLLCFGHLYICSVKVTEVAVDRLNGRTRDKSAIAFSVISGIR